MMKRYWLFVWFPYEALGGFSDFKTAYDSIENQQYMKFVEQLYKQHNTPINYQVLDSFNGTIIDQGKYQG